MRKKNLLNKFYEKKINFLSLFFIILIPVILFKFNGIWIFTRTKSLDPWIYTAYFLYTQKYLNLFMGTYYGTRLPWIIPGHVVFHLFGSIIGNYILHLFIYFLSIFSFYHIMKRLKSSMAMMIALYLFGSYPIFLFAIGWNYVDAPGITYLLLTLSFVMAYKYNEKKYLLIFLSGIFFSAMIFTNLFLLVFSPIFLFVLFFGKKIQVSLLKRMLLFGFGVLTLTISLCLINHHYTSKFLFFGPHFLELKNLLSSANPMKHNLFTWIHKALWLSFPFSIFLISAFIFFINFKKQRGENELAMFFIVSYLIIFPFFVILNLTPYAPVLELPYYATYLIPWMFLSLGSCLSLNLSTLEAESNYYKIAIFIFLPIATMLFFSLPNLFLAKIGHYISHYKSVTGISALVLFAYALLMISPKKMLRYSVMLFIILTMMASVLTKNFIMESSVKHVFREEKNKFVTVMDTEKIVHAFDSDGQTRFWIEHDSKIYFNIYIAVASIHLWLYRLIGHEFPEIFSYIKFFPGEKIVILSRKTNVIDTAKIVLKKRGFYLSKVERKKISRGDLDFYAYFIQISPLTKSVTSL